MLRINLLPAYVAQRRLRRTLVLAFTLAFALVIVAMVGWFAALQKPLADVTEKANEAQSAKQQIDNLTSQAQTISGQIPAFKTNVDFVNSVRDYNLKYAQLYTNISRYTSPRILYSNLSVNQTTLTIDAYAPSLPELARYMQYMYNEPDISGLSVSAIPAYHSSYSPSTKQYTLPALPPGYVAHFPGSSIPVHSFTVTNGQVTEIGDANEQVGMQPEAGAGGAPTRTRLYNPNMGFEFTATAVLKAAITPPALPGAGGGNNNQGNGGPGGAPPGPPA